MHSVAGDRHSSQGGQLVSDLSLRDLPPIIRADDVELVTIKALHRLEQRI
jgi:hypothetical protein